MGGYHKQEHSDSNWEIEVWSFLFYPLDYTLIFRGTPSIIFVPSITLGYTRYKNLVDFNYEKFSLKFLAKLMPTKVGWSAEPGINF